MKKASYTSRITTMKELAAASLDLLEDLANDQIDLDKAAQIYNGIGKITNIHKMRIKFPESEQMR